MNAFLCFCSRSVLLNMNSKQTTNVCLFEQITKLHVMCSAWREVSHSCIDPDTSLKILAFNIPRKSIKIVQNYLLANVVRHWLSFVCMCVNGILNYSKVLKLCHYVQMAITFFKSGISTNDVQRTNFIYLGEQSIFLVVN